VGPGQQPGVDLGPLVSSAQLARVGGFLDASRQDGAQVVTGGNRIEGPGYFIEPTVLAQTRQEMSAVREEIFGPVLCAMPIEDEDLQQIARLGNDTTYGLAAYIWTQNLGVAHRLARMLRAGWVRVNGGTGAEHHVPFGGYKQSGWGRERGREGVEAFMETKSVIMSV
jgi:phenylacetaldehyde dehydrogenase